MKKILEEISKTDIASITSDMIKIPSYSFMEGEQEKEMAYYIKKFFDNEGIECQVSEIEKER